MNIIEHARFGKVGSYLFNIMKSLNHDELVSGFVHKNLTEEHLKNQYLISDNCFNHLVIPANYNYILGFDEYRFDNYLCKTEEDSHSKSISYFDNVEKNFLLNYEYFVCPKTINMIYTNKESGYGYRSIYFFLDFIFNIFNEKSAPKERIHSAMTKISSLSDDLFLVKPRKRIPKTIPKKYQEIETQSFLNKREVVFDMWSAMQGQIPRINFSDIAKVNPLIFKKTKVATDFGYIPLTSYIGCRDLFKLDPEQFGQQVRVALESYSSLDPKTRLAFVSVLTLIGAVTQESASLFRKDRSTLVQEHFLKMICINKSLYPDLESLTHSYLQLKGSYLSEHIRIILAYYGPFEWLPFLLGTNRKSTSLLVDKRMERGF